MARSKTVYRIGHLADVVGVTVDTLRYYEREGLLSPIDRTAGGFREYSKETARRLQFIKQARALGLSLYEIRQLIDPENGRCHIVRRNLVERLADVDRRMLELASFRKTLTAALERCEETLKRSKNAPCPVIGQLGT